MPVNPGQFIYPPPDGVATLGFNYLDTVLVSWETLAQNATPTYLSIFYYLQGDPWKLGYNVSVPVNGTKAIELNLLNEAYYAQFNMFYQLEGDGGLGKYLSSFFNVGYDSSRNPVTWGSVMTATSSVPVSTSSSTSSSTSTTTSISKATTSITTTAATTGTTLATARTTVATTSAGATEGGANLSAQTSSPTPSATHSSSGELSGGAIAGIVIGAVIAVTAILAIGIFFWRKLKAAQDSQIASANGLIEEKKEIEYRQPPMPTNFQELSSNRQTVELSSSRMLSELP
ncbi:hypothetical protein BGW36DRAFT_367149 [Talaromyces proteolyticus]|uniref:Mid2 domain-containing protein n=1 Tax=Talaromyces proteolyticus TaxID=1131652 RepID=A0AAD4L3H7_9EURO|nr:uncharacterized protein BGW36DRAFT_367149 [Talaromyces proteolyticus]KAH8705233.1 hypothetical protein BGW36DRAFT_367149 [Talaromyces proteolyticus]